MIMQMPCYLLSLNEQPKQNSKHIRKRYDGGKFDPEVLKRQEKDSWKKFLVSGGVSPA